MATLFLLLFFLIVLLVLLGCAVWILVERCSNMLDKAEGILATQPKETRRLAQTVVDRLERLPANRIIPGVRDSFCRASVLLAVLDHRKGNVADTAQHIKRLREWAGADLDDYLLDYYLGSENVSDLALGVYAKLLGKGKTAENAEQYDEAAELMQTACEIRPHLSQSEMRTALERNKLAANALPEEEWPRLNQGTAHLALGQYREALAVYDAFLAWRPGRPIALSGRARCHAKLGNPAAAEADLDVMLRSSKVTPEMMLEAAEQYGDLGAAQKASAVLTRLSSVNPAMASRCLAVKGRVAVKARQAASILPELRAAYSTVPDDQLGVVLAEAYTQTGDYPNAALVAQTVYARGTTQPERQYLLAAALYNADFLTRATPLFEACKAAKHREAAIALPLARCYLQQNRHRDAVPLLRGKRDAAFELGVALMHTGELKEALAIFKRLFEQARKAGKTDLAKRTLHNFLACCVRFGNENEKAGNFLQAAKGFELALQLFKKKQPFGPQILQAAARCYCKEAFRLLKKGGPHAAAHAIPHVQKALGHVSDAETRHLLGVLHYRAGQADAAAAVYRDLARERPNEDRFHFGLGLALLQGANEAQARQTLTDVAQANGPYAQRAALALAELKVQQKDYVGGVQTLVPLLSQPSVTGDPFYEEVYRKVLFYALRSGNKKQAEALARNLPSKKKGGSNVVLGCLLAQEGDFAGALPYLEEDGAALQGSGHSRMLRQVRLRLARERCSKREFREALPLLDSALSGGADPAVQRFRSLAEAAAGQGAGVVDDGVLDVLDGLDTGNRDTRTVWSRAVAHHRRAYDLAKAGNHGGARRRWEQARELWTRHIKGQAMFWGEYVSDYNVGKEYPLQTNPTELSDRLSQMLAGLSLSMCGERLKDGDLAQGRLYWQDAVGVSGTTECRTLFKQYVDVNALAGLPEFKDNPGKLRQLIEFVYAEIDPDPVYRDVLGNLTLADAFAALRNQQGSRFLGLIEEAARYVNDLPIANIRRLSSSVIEEISRQFQRHQMHSVVQQAAPQMLDNFLWNLVLAYSMLAEQIPGGMNTYHVSQSFDKIVVLVFQAIVKK